MQNIIQSLNLYKFSVLIHWKGIFFHIILFHIWFILVCVDPSDIRAPRLHWSSRKNPLDTRIALWGEGARNTAFLILTNITGLSHLEANSEILKYRMLIRECSLDQHLWRGKKLMHDIVPVTATTDLTQQLGSWDGPFWSYPEWARRCGLYKLLHLLISWKLGRQHELH